jgi:hypothetical protein
MKLKFMGSPLSPVVENLFMEHFERKALDSFPHKPKWWLRFVCASPSWMCLPQKNKTGSLGHHVYRKETHTDRYLHVESHHHPAQKIGVIKTLATQAMRVSDGDHLDQEISHLTKVLKINGYKGK